MIPPRPAFPKQDDIIHRRPNQILPYQTGQAAVNAIGPEGEDLMKIISQLDRAISYKILEEIENTIQAY